MTLFDRILAARGFDEKTRAAFLSPDYAKNHDPFLLPDMKKAIERLMIALEKQEKIVIYGDYDIDGLTSTALILDAFDSFGYKNVDAFIPNRFVEGYGMSIDAVRQIAKDGADLIITVDCGSLSHKEISESKKLGVDVIVTDHHEVTEVLPSAVAVINPKRNDSKYPFSDLASVGVAFKLVQAMQVKLNKSLKNSGLPFGQEKWLLDLVALGTVCDVVNLLDENRIFVHWGLKVLSQTKRPGLRALMAISGIDPKKVNARALGFSLGPRMNASGRLETARHALDLLITNDPKIALQKAEQLDGMNKARRLEQDRILKEAIEQAEKFRDDPVLVLSDPDWNHGINGIVAAKILEKFKKPAFILQEIMDESKGSARSFGDFSAVEAIRASQDVITKGGGHKFAAGVTLPTKNIVNFRKSVNEYHKKLKLANQHDLLLPIADVVAELNEVTEDLIEEISRLEPFGHGNPRPVLKGEKMIVTNIRRMGSDGQHLKLSLKDNGGTAMNFLAFNAQDYFFVELGKSVDIWYEPNINEWQGTKSIEGSLLHIENL